MKMKSLLLGAVLAMGITTSANAGMITIDDFSDDQGPMVVMQGQTLFSSVLGSMIGGERDLEITSVVDEFNQGASVNVAADNFFFSSGAGNESMFTIQWDGVDGSNAINPFGLGGLDLTAIGNPIKFITTIIESDLNAWFDVTFWSGPNGTAETVELPIPGVNRPGRDAFFLSREFSNTDFTNIGAIQVRGNIASPDTGLMQRSYDLQLGGVTAVPEPGSLALALLAVLGIAVRRRA
tara:strand:+ start:29588 stop:30298 length:711 start_codon:yes stop_codon:yes gene_type:complete